MMKTKITHIFIVQLVLLLIGSAGNAQETENNFEYRATLDLKFNPWDKIKFSFEPELRFEDALSFDEYLLEGEMEYEAFKYISFGASYGLKAKIDAEKDTEYLNRYSLSSSFQKDFNRFEASMQLKYSNYADDDVIDKNYMRYKLKLEYDINDCKLTPELAVQPYQSLSGFGLHKIRYLAGVDYKIYKKHYLEASYELDYYYQEYKNKHIFSFGYKYKF